MKKRVNQSLNWLLVMAMLAALAPFAALAAPPAQEITCAEAYTVQADDWLSKIADKYLGDVMAYPAIVEATNQKNAVDDTFANITNPDLIEIGWKLCVPDAETAQDQLTAEADGDEEATEPDRGDILAEIEVAEAILEGDPDNAELAHELAGLHYKAGHFNTAKEVLQPFLDAGMASDDSKLLMGELKYLTGNYAAAEEILLDLTENASDTMTQIMAQVKLLFVYYQTNEYAKTQDLLPGMEGQIQLPTWDFMKGYGEEAPYQVDWNGQTETALPFVLADPLPVVEVEINGELIYAFLDTGGDAFVVDTDLAAALGIEQITTFKGTYAGGLQADTSYAKADSLKLGDVTITSVPVMILPIERFSEGFAEGQYRLRGVLGTATLRQFLSTVDYENEQIILRPKTEAAKETLMSSFAGKQSTAMPFALAATHLMMAKGQLNEVDDMTLFVDSGLADEAGAKMTAPLQTLNYVGIPVPETAVDENSIGGGGGAGFATGHFPVDKLGLGDLVQTDAVGLYGTSTPESYWQLGFIQDGLISHNFLRQYDSWTLDFSEMTMLFAQ